MKKILNQFGTKPLIKKEAGSLVQQEHIKNQIVVLPELESLIPPLLSEEYQQLESNIRQEGCREPLLVWHTNGEQIGRAGDSSPVYVLIDGHNRYGICQRNGIDFKIALREFPDLETVRGFMIDNQLGRRNLTPEQMSYLRGQKYLSLKKTTGRPDKQQRTAPAETPTGALPNPARGVRTEQALADQFKVSPKTIRLDATYARGLDKLAEPLKKEVLARKVKLTKGDIIALGELKSDTRPVTSPEELSALLGSEPARKKAAKAAAGTSPVPDQLAQVVALTQQLRYPSDGLASTCREMIQTLQSVLQQLEEAN